MGNVCLLNPVVYHYLGVMHVGYYLKIVII